MAGLGWNRRGLVPGVDQLLGQLLGFDVGGVGFVLASAHHHKAHKLKLEQ
jgi:hypothetical protein